MGKKKIQKFLRKNIKKNKIKPRNINKEKDKIHSIKMKRLKRNKNHRISVLNRELTGKANIYKSGSEKSNSCERNSNLKKFKIFPLNKIRKIVRKKKIILR